MNDFPIYRVDISDNDASPEEVNFIALVKNPAIESNFLKFSEPGGKMRFAIDNEEERIVTGLAMIANLPIYRRDKERGEYYVYFDADTIKKIALRFFRKGYKCNLNFEHNPDAPANGVYVFESMIIDRAKGKNPPPAFDDVEDGSWLISAKVDDDKAWEDVKAGKFNGFSVEGMFFLEKMEFGEDKDRKFIEALREIMRDFEL